MSGQRESHMYKKEWALRTRLIAASAGHISTTARVALKMFSRSFVERGSCRASLTTSDSCCESGSESSSRPLRLSELRVRPFATPARVSSWKMVDARASSGSYIRPSHQHNANEVRW